MKIVECEQGTQSWFAVRMGIPTASMFDHIITPDKLELSKAEKRYKYAERLLAEWLTGMPTESDFQSFAMLRGLEMEPRARSWYEVENGVKVEQVGFCMTDDEDYGCSPDGIIGEEGGLEIKCPEGPQCVAYLTGREKPGTDKHRLQIMGSLLITGFAYWDCLVWHPDMNRIPPVLVRIERDEDVIGKIRTHLNTFLSELKQAKIALQEKGCNPVGKVVTFTEIIR